MCFVYLDDILVIGSTQHQVAKNMNFMVETLCQAGLKINVKKSVLEPSQVVHHLGLDLNFKEGLLQVAPAKLKVDRRDLGKLVTLPKMSCRKMQQF